MAGPGNILIKVGADAGQAVRELSTVEKSLGSTMSTSEKMGAGLKKAALPAAAALTALGVAGYGAAKAASEDAAAQEHLSGVLQRVAGASKAQIKQTEDWISTQSRATGVADDDLRPALEKIATATGDVTSAQDLLTKALDISAASGKDVDTVATAIAKGYTGQTAALSKLVPGLSEAAKESKKFGTIMGELGDKTGGAMAAQAETAAGKMQILSVQVGELQESIGTALLPVIETLVPILAAVADLASENTTAVKILIGVVAALAAGILVANAAMKAYSIYQAIFVTQTNGMTVAQRALNFAMSSNPIGLVIVALAALAAGLVIAYQRSETFRAIVTAAFNAVKAAASALASGFSSLLDTARSVFNWIVAHWNVAQFAFGPIGVAITQIVKHFDTLKAVATAVLDAISGAVRGLASAIDSVISAVERLIGWLGRIKVPHIDLPGPFSLPGAAPAVAGHGARASGPVTVNVYGAIDPEGTARTIQRVLADHDRRQGRQGRA